MGLKKTLYTESTYRRSRERKMATRKTIMIGSAIILLGAASWLLLDASPKAPGSASSPVSPTNTANSDSAQPASTIDPLTEKSAFLATLGKQMREKWNERLSNPYWRMKMLDDLRVLFQKRFGDAWQQELEAFLRATFPEWAEDLIKKMFALQEYNQWVEQLKSTMQFSSMKERQAALWEKRVALFGDEAYVIWEAALKNEQLQAKLEEVNTSTGTFAEKSEQYINGMREVFGQDIIGPDKPHTSQMMTQFLQLPNVQGDLQQLPEAERYEQLRAFRRAMGLNEEAMQRWDTLDQQRIEERSNGTRYMEQRATLESRYQGEELQRQLERLQNELFGPEEATFIRNEESTGYYRFSQPQIIGVN